MSTQRLTIRRHSIVPGMRLVTRAGVGPEVVSVVRDGNTLTLIAANGERNRGDSWAWECVTSDSPQLLVVNDEGYA